ncbi:MAG: type II secretion system F family protein [Rhodopirellula sp.]|nr:type II secretion system F family protein [Rhodopirellula sp.]
MSDQPARSSAAIRLEELLALNDEIGALIRAGVPLDLGLRQYGMINQPGIPGEYKDRHAISVALGRLSNRLADRISSGNSLQAAIDQEGDHLPGIYRAVVEAGIRAGRLPEALEALSVVARVLLKLHRQIVAALIYPAIVLGMVWLLLIGFAEYIIPRLLQTWEFLRLDPGPAMQMLVLIRDTLPYWGIGTPVLAVAAFVWLQIAGSRNSATPAGRLVASRLYRFAWIPGVVKNYDYATFLKILALLVEHETPLHEALVLAGYTTGNRDIIRDSSTIAQRLQNGDSLQESLKSATRLPRFLRWMLRTGEENGKLSETLKLTADVYEKRASRRAELLRVVLPVVLTIFIAGSVTLLYGVILFAPLRELYDRLGDPVLR